MAEVLRVNPIKMLVYYNEKLIPIRRYDAVDFFTQDELDFYTTAEKITLRATKVQSFDFCSIKQGLVSELGNFLTK